MPGRSDKTKDTVEQNFDGVFHPNHFAKARCEEAGVIPAIRCAMR